MKLRRYLATMIFMLVASPVLACSCPAVLPDSASGRAQAVFSGKIIRSGKSNWTVEVDRVWKGEVESQIELFDAHAGTSCATRGFRKGRLYLFLADIHTDDQKIRYSPQVCNWTTALKAVKMSVKDHVISIGDGPEARWVEDWLLEGQGEGKPPLTAPARKSE